MRDVACGRDQKLLQILVGKSEGKRSLRRPERPWEDDIKIDVKETQGRKIDCGCLRTGC
jgi:hypothetical protein